jgi:hypothetical protein
MGAMSMKHPPSVIIPHAYFDTGTGKSHRNNIKYKNISFHLTSEMSENNFS